MNKSPAIAGKAITGPPKPPTTSPRLEDWLARASNPHPDAGLGDVPDAVRIEAGALLPRLEASMATATAQDWEWWLKPLTVLPNGPKSQADLFLAIGPIAFALHDLPAAVLTMDRQREALRRFTFWPKPAELHAMLSPEARPLQARQTAFRRLANAAPPAQRRAPTDAERQHVAAGNAGDEIVHQPVSAQEP